MGSNTCLCTPNGPRPLLKKCAFDPSFTLFCSQNGPFSRHIGIFHGPKPVPMGSKWAKKICLSISVGPGSLLGKHLFDPFLVPKRPIFKAFWDFLWAKTHHHGSKWAKNTCLSIPNGPRSLLEKCIFDPIFDPFLVPNRPIFKAFWDFPWPKTRRHGLKTGSKHLFEHPSWSRNNFGKMIFFALGTLVNPPAPPSDHLYGGVGVSLGDSKGWNLQKVGGCGWTRGPRNRILSHVAQDTAPAWFRGVGAHAQILGLFGAFLGRFSNILWSSRAIKGSWSYGS